MKVSCISHKLLVLSATYLGHDLKAVGSMDFQVSALICFSYALCCHFPTLSVLQLYFAMLCHTLCHIPVRLSTLACFLTPHTTFTYFPLVVILSFVFQLHTLVPRLSLVYSTCIHFLRLPDKLILVSFTPCISDLSKLCAACLHSQHHGLCLQSSAP